MRSAPKIPKNYEKLNNPYFADAQSRVLAEVMADSMKSILNRIDERFDENDRHLDERFAEIYKRFDENDRHFNERFDMVDHRFDMVDRRLGQVQWTIPLYFSTIVIAVLIVTFFV